MHWSFRSLSDAETDAPQGRTPRHPHICIERAVRRAPTAVAAGINARRHQEESPAALTLSLTFLSFLSFLSFSSFLFFYCPVQLVMISFSFERVLFALLLSSITHVCSVFAAPVGWGTLDLDARDILARSTAAAPHFVVYGDQSAGTNGPPDPSAIKVGNHLSELVLIPLTANHHRTQGFNVFALSFLLGKGPADKAQEWASLDASKRASIKSQYAKAGIKLIVSAFGGTEQPTTKKEDPVATANTMAAWVIKYGLDGIDVDYEVCLYLFQDCVHSFIKYSFRPSRISRP